MITTRVEYNPVNYTNYMRIQTRFYKCGCVGKSTNCYNYLVLDKFTSTLENNNYLNIDLIAYNIMNSLLSTACIYSIAIYIDPLDENCNLNLFKNTHKSF